MDFETMEMILDSSEHLNVECEDDDYKMYSIASRVFITIYDGYNDVRLTFKMPRGWELIPLVLNKNDEYWDFEIPLFEHFNVPCYGRFRTDQIDEIVIEKL